MYGFWKMGVSKDCVFLHIAERSQWWVIVASDTLSSIDAMYHLSCHLIMSFMDYCMG